MGNDDAQDPRPGAPGLVLDAGLVLTAGLLPAAVALAAAGSEAGRELFSLALGCHVLLALYDGRFGRFRTASWLLLVLGFFATAAAGFLAYVLPWGQMSFWFVAWVGMAGPEALDWVARAVAAGPLLIPAAVCLDVAAMHGNRVRRLTRFRAAVLGAAVLAVAGFAVLASATTDAPPPVDDPLTPARILPSPDTAAVYALLRTVPSKTAGVALAALVLILPAFAPWSGAWRFHGGRLGPLWAALCAGLAGSWIGLTALGLAMPDDGVVGATRALTAYVVAFFVLAPILLGALARPRSPAIAAVFD